MSFEEFQQLARLYTIGALDLDELEQFNLGRKHFGTEAEAFLDECQRLNALIALSLLPKKPSAGLKARLMAKIRKEQAKSPDFNGEIGHPLLTPASSGKQGSSIFGLN
ncbi:MAG TPA: hypothetical protein VNQ90_12145 [Chthoniobacteraceae bacterium]|nr:hypothetical protein [Chthoniobacteraceae bacterium]